MRGTVSKRLGNQAKKETIGEPEWKTDVRKDELKAEYLNAKRVLPTVTPPLSKRQQRFIDYYKEIGGR